MGPVELSKAFLEGLKARADQHGNPGFDAHVLSGVEIKSAEAGRIVCRIAVPSNLTNGYGTLHGGAIATLVDCVSTLAVVTKGGLNTGVSIDLNITYVSSAKIGEELEIESSVLKLGKNIVMLSAELRKANGGEIIANGHHTKYLSSSSKMIFAKL